MWVNRSEPVPDRAQLGDVYAQLSSRIQRQWDRDTLLRPDGFTYAVDVGQLLIHAVHSEDKSTYERIRDGAVPLLVQNDPDDPFTRGFVAWRIKSGTPPDASGTTEALRVAAGLWFGGQRFDFEKDRALARTIVEGYGRHAYVDQGVWLIRNYFNFQTRGFANDSYLVDYDPDLIANMAVPKGLFHTLIQPDVKTIMPDAPVMVFSPNDVIQMNNACAVASTVTVGGPDMAHSLVDFALRHGGDLKRAYYGRDGVSVDETPADSTAWSCLVRVAAQLDRHDALEVFLPLAFPHWQWLAQDTEPRPFALIEALLALDALLAHRP